MKTRFAISVLVLGLLASACGEPRGSSPSDGEAPFVFGGEPSVFDDVAGQETCSALPEGEFFGFAVPMATTTMWIETTVGSIRADLLTADVTGTSDESLGAYAIVDPSRLVVDSSVLYDKHSSDFSVIKYRYELFDAVAPLPEDKGVLVGFQGGRSGAPVADIVAVRGSDDGVAIVGNCWPEAVETYVAEYAAAVGLSEWEALRQFGLAGQPGPTIKAYERGDVISVQDRWDATPLDLRILEVGVMPLSVQDGLRRSLASLTVPSSWSGQDGVVCVRVEAGWSDCADLTLADDTGVVEWTFFYEPGAAAQLWLLNESGEVSSPLALLGDFVVGEEQDCTPLDVWGDLAALSNSSGARADVLASGSHACDA